MLVCKRGRRAEQARQTLQCLGFTALSVLRGGMEAWSAAGKPILKETRQQATTSGTVPR